MDTLTWRNRVVLRQSQMPLERCKRVKRLQCMSKKRTYSWLWKSSRTRQQFYCSESLATKTDILTSGSMVKNHISFIQCNTENFVPIAVPGVRIWANTVFILTSLKTEIARWTDQNYKGPVQKTQRGGGRGGGGEAVPRADNFGDLITADHEVPSDNCESRNNHRYAVVMQDPTQWIQSYPCKNKTSQETQRSLQKFLEPDRKPKVIYTHNSLEFGKACDDLSWNHCTSTPHRSETNVIAERAVRRVKEGTSAVLLQSGLKKLVSRFHGMLDLSAKCYRSLMWWENSVWETLWWSL